MLNPSIIKQFLPWSAKTFQIVGLSNEPQESPISKPVPFCSGPLRDTHTFILSSFTPIQFLGQDFLEKYIDRMYFSQKGGIILEIDSSHGSKPPVDLNDL